MKRIRYSTSVDNDVVYSWDTFSEEVEMYLEDPDGWASMGYVFEEVDRSPDVVIRLSSPDTIRKVGCSDGSLSCAQMNGKHMYLNAMRWTRGAPNSKLPLDEYRQYMVSHEMGHILGHDHVACPSPGAPAPIMMQQTIGIGRCSPNTKLTQLDRKKKQ